MTVNTGEVKSFYNSFLTDRMISYRLKRNARIEAAISLLRQHISSTDVVVDIGCGIGIATEAAARQAERGQVVGVDISEENIRFATATVFKENASFHCLDVINEHHRLIEIISGRRVDVFLLIDVIEHLPDDVREQIFKTMSDLATDRSTVIITYPSPFYQLYLKAHKPEELQIIDHVVTLNQLVAEAGRHGFEISSYELKDIWRPAQYVHCVLRKSKMLHDDVGQQLAKDLRTRMRRFVDRVMLPVRRRKYITRVRRLQLGGSSRRQ